MTIYTCKVCGNTNNKKLHQIKKMQLGLKEYLLVRMRKVLLDENDLSRVSNQ